MNLKFVISRYKYLFREKLRELILPPRMMKERHAVLESLHANDNNSSSKCDSIVFLTSHTADPFASRGDEAMLIAITEKLKERNPKLKLAILVETDVTAEVVNKLESIGFKVIKSWSYPWSLAAQVKHMKNCDGLFCIGADVMDGYYSTIKSLRLWMCIDVMARMGKPSNVGGFSFNENPSKYVVKFLSKHLSDNATVCLRDPVSHKRFEDMTNKNVECVADTAFMLNPQSTVEFTKTAIDWIDGKREGGRKPMVINLHPMLIPDRNPATIKLLVDSAIKTVRRLVTENNCSFVLLPHDFRDNNTGDLWFLRNLIEGLPEIENELFFVKEEIPAKDIKFIASKTDLAITGRMHLSIGALGTGTPIMGITYQGKFEGLVEHFKLPYDILISPEEIVDPERFYSFCLSGVNRVNELTEQVKLKLPEVKDLSLRNLDSIS